MSKKTDVISIGGGPAAIVAAISAKKRYKDKKVTIIRNVEKSPIPCGIPYVFGSLDSADQNVIPDKLISDNDIDLVIDEAISIDKENKVVKTKSGEEYAYEKLIIATGSKPAQIPIDGINMPGVYVIKKDTGYLNKMKEEISKVQNVVVIGGGFIGIEMADEVNKMGKKTTIVEFLPHCLMLAFDKEFCAQIEGELSGKGINILTNSKVKKIIGNSKVEKVILADGKELKADAVIVGIGAIPNTDLAKQADLEVNAKGSIVVNEYMKTSDKDISAAGDCVAKTDFFTNDSVQTMLASTACSEARIAGMNLYQLQILKQNTGTIGIFSTGIDEISMAAAGLTEHIAKEKGYEVIVGEASAPDRHPGGLKNMSMTKVKLIFSKQSGIILGGQISGGISVGEMINIIGFAIQTHLTIINLITFQIGSHPLLTASPIAYQIIGAAQNALSKVNQ